MFASASAISWSEFFSPGEESSEGLDTSATRLRTVAQADSDTDVIKIDKTAADARNVQELERRIKAAGGALTADPNSTDYIVAINNRLKFSVTPGANGQFVIRDSQSYLLLIGLAVVVGVVVLSKR